MEPRRMPRVRVFYDSGRIRADPPTFATENHFFANFRFSSPQIGLTPNSTWPKNRRVLASHRREISPQRQLRFGAAMTILCASLRASLTLSSVELD